MTVFPFCYYALMLYAKRRNLFIPVCKYVIFCILNTFFFLLGAEQFGLAVTFWRSVRIGAGTVDSYDLPQFLQSNSGISPPIRPRSFAPDPFQFTCHHILQCTVFLLPDSGHAMSRLIRI